MCSGVKENIHFCFCAGLNISVHFYVQNEYVCVSVSD